MFIATILISILSLVLSGYACWRVIKRADARQSTQQLRSEFQHVAARHKELVESAAQLLDDAYARTRQQVAAAREFLRRLKHDAASGLEERAALALEQLEALSTRLEENVDHVRTATATAARRAHATISQRVFHLKARTILLLAEAKAKNARAAVIEQRYVEAEELLDEANDLMRRAAEDLGGEPHYEVMVENIRRASREAMVSLRAHAQLTASKMDRLLAESGRLVTELESEEKLAAGRAAAPAKSREAKNHHRPMAAA